MASISVPANNSPHAAAQITVSAHAASTAYEAVLTWASGRTQIVPFVTDGSGAATLTKVVPGQDDRGTLTITTRPSLSVPVVTTTTTTKVV